MCSMHCQISSASSYFSGTQQPYSSRYFIADYKNIVCIGYICIYTSYFITIKLLVISPASHRIYRHYHCSANTISKNRTNPQNSILTYFFSIENELLHWCILLLVFSVLSIYPTVIHNIYFMVSPLIIILVKMAEVTSPAGRNPLKVYAVMALAPWIGTAWRFLSVDTLVPAYLTFPCALVCLYILMELIQFPFTAASSLVTLSFLCCKNTDLVSCTIHNRLNLLYGTFYLYFQK